MCFLTTLWQRIGPLGPARRERRRVRRLPSKSALRCRPLLEVLEARTVPSTFLVTNLNDSGSGSLRAAVQSADATTGATIKFAHDLSGTITLTSGELDLTNSMSINGPGANKIAVSGDNRSGVFEVAAGANVTLKDLTITDGNSGDGGGIDNEGSLTVSDCTLSSNSAQIGGGIYNASGSSLMFSGSTLSGNFASQAAGGVTNAGIMTIRDSTLSGNSAYNAGGVSNSGSMTIRDSMVSGNTAVQCGGGVFNFATLAVSDSALSGNNVVLNGGGVFNEGSLTIRDSILSGNSANFYGGGIDNGGTLTVSDSVLSGNSAAYGGGLDSFHGTVTVSDSILSGNSAAYGGGGIYNSYGKVTVSNCRVTGNSAAKGGGIYTLGSSLSLVGDNLIFGNSPNNIVYG